ncbi:hypothetical protein FHR99_001835 [Litorivivens lipolytica]|uniref:Uncharacterized protein n=1 Tax=Litorivivens lipolytica TaxID=1524264 RepID=A0A7W4Z5K2_9GAMM|nr:hypothetical protein [Litorivivens lipolytica]
MNPTTSTYASDIAENTAKFSVLSILVTGFIYCIALLV